MIDRKRRANSMIMQSLRRHCLVFVLSICVSMGFLTIFGAVEPVQGQTGLTEASLQGTYVVTQLTYSPKNQSANFSAWAFDGQGNVTLTNANVVAVLSGAVDRLNLPGPLTGSYVVRADGTGTIEGILAPPDNPTIFAITRTDGGIVQEIMIIPGAQPGTTTGELLAFRGERLNVDGD